jgi:hypothetical protein
MSCVEKEFTSFNSPDTHYTIHHKKGFLLRSLNTDGEGVRKLQLFTKDGKLVEEQRMYNEPFLVESWTADTITVKYLAGDLRFFLPWFKDNIRRQPSKLGSFNIRYSYEKVMGSSALAEYESDSLSFQKEEYLVNLFNQKKLIASIPLDSLSIYREQLIQSIKRENGILFGSRYTIERRLAKQLLEAIISDEN